MWRSHTFLYICCSCSTTPALQHKSVLSSNTCCCGKGGRRGIHVFRTRDSQRINIRTYRCMCVYANLCVCMRMLVRVRKHFRTLSLVFRWNEVYIGCVKGILHVSLMCFQHVRQIVDAAYAPNRIYSCSICQKRLWTNINFSEKLKHWQTQFSINYSVLYKTERNVV